MTADRRCEVGERVCPFADRPVHFARRDRTPRRSPNPLGTPRVWVDFRPDRSDERELGVALERLATLGVGVLVGEHVDDPDPRPPALVAHLVAASGIPTITTLTCRDRTAADHRVQIDAMIDAGVHAVHCVTGDHPRARLDVDWWPTFHLDGTGLAHLAATMGARVSVAESPASPPISDRARRLRSKQDAGAEIAILNHAGSVADLTAFARSCLRAGVTLDLIAPVPVVTDHRSAEALSRFPGLRLPPGHVEAVLASPRPLDLGIDAAAAMASDLLATGAFSGVNLSGAGAAGDLATRAAVMAEVARRISAPATHDDDCGSTLA